MAFSQYDEGEKIHVKRLDDTGTAWIDVDGPNPVADEAAFKVVRLIVGRLTWRPGDPSREWLIRWFVDDRVTSGDLYAVTSALGRADLTLPNDDFRVLTGGLPPASRHSTGTCCDLR